MKKLLFFIPTMLMVSNVWAGECNVKPTENGYTYGYSCIENNKSCDLLENFKNCFENWEPTTQATTVEVTTEATTVQTTVETSTEATTKETTTIQTTVEQTTEVTTEQITNSNNEAQQILALVNKERAANGLSPLTLNAEVSNVAQKKAEDMQMNNYFSHTSPQYGSPFDMLKSFGVNYNTAGENIAKGQRSAQAVMEAWMNSDGHRKNILNASFKELGVGYVYKNGTTYWVQMFIG